MAIACCGIRACFGRTSSPIAAIALAYYSIALVLLVLFKSAVRSVDTVGLGEENEFVILAEGIDRTSGLDVLLARIV